MIMTSLGHTDVLDVTTLLPLPRMKQAIYMGGFKTLTDFRAKFFNNDNLDRTNADLMSAWFNGTRRPRSVDLRRLSDLTGVSVDWILEITDDPIVRR